MSGSPDRPNRPSARERYDHLVATIQEVRENLRISEQRNFGTPETRALRRRRIEVLRDIANDEHAAALAEAVDQDRSPRVAPPPSPEALLNGARP